jgi:hypothetical protein
VVRSIAQACPILDAARLADDLSIVRDWSDAEALVEAIVPPLGETGFGFTWRAQQLLLVALIVWVANRDEYDDRCTISTVNALLVQPYE